jgi:hypothetical protein
VICNYIIILDSRFHGNDKQGWLDSRFHGNDDDDGGRQWDSLTEG